MHKFRPLANGQSDCEARGCRKGEGFSFSEISKLKCILNYDFFAHY